MRVRWCCAEYKETAGAGKVTLIGIRKAESSRRAKRNEVEINNRKFSGDLDGLDEYRQKQKAKRVRRKSKEQGVNITNADEEQTLGCIQGKESLLLSPIIYWTEQDVWEFLNDVVKVPHCSLYDEGWHRIGCIGCPMSSHKQKMLENERYPHVRRSWIKAIKAIRNGGYSKKIISGGTSTRTGCLSETSEDCSGRRAATSSIPTRNIGSSSILQTIRLGVKYEERQCRRSAFVNSGCGQSVTGRPVRRNTGVWGLAALGFRTAPLLTA